jgi:hypothetical protein
VREPAAILAEARRVLAEGPALLLLIDTGRGHDRAEYRTTMGHEHLGFSEADLEGLATPVKFTLDIYRPLRPAIDAKGPGLFVARLVK